MSSSGEGSLNEDPKTLEAAASHFSNIFNFISPARHEGFAWNIAAKEVWGLTDQIFGHEKVLGSILTLSRKKAVVESGVINEPILFVITQSLPTSYASFSLFVLEVE